MLFIIYRQLNTLRLSDASIWEKKLSFNINSWPLRNLEVIWVYKSECCFLDKGWKCQFSLHEFLHYSRCETKTKKENCGLLHCTEEKNPILLFLFTTKTICVQKVEHKLFLWLIKRLLQPGRQGYCASPLKRIKKCVLNILSLTRNKNGGKEMDYS